MAKDATSRGAPLKLLLTGFGPFPGIPQNPSTDVVEAMARRLGGTPHLDLHTHIFATEWQRVADEATALLERVHADIVVQFGLCRGANAFRIERCAYDAASDLEDAAGARPAHPAILTGGAPRLDTACSTNDIARALRGQDFPALPSLSAGRYLCNFLYYLTLDWARQRPHAPLVLFVHIPLTQEQGGYLTEPEIEDGAEALLKHLLESRLSAKHDPTTKTCAA